MSIFINILLVVEVLSALLIILLVLMQRPKNEGLGAAFGGGMTENLFGAQTTNVLQSFTRNLGIFFFALTALISWLYVKQGTIKSDIQKQLATAPAVPAATPVPLATPAPGTIDGGPTNTALLPPVEPSKGSTPPPAEPNATPPVSVPAPVPGKSPAPTGEKSADAPAPPTPNVPPAGQTNPPAAPGNAPAPASPAAPESKPADKPVDKSPGPAPDAPKPPQ